MGGGLGAGEHVSSKTGLAPAPYATNVARVQLGVTHVNVFANSLSGALLPTLASPTLGDLRVEKIFGFLRKSQHSNTFLR